MAAKRVCGPCRTALASCRNVIRPVIDVSRSQYRSMATEVSLPTANHSSPLRTNQITLDTTPSTAPYSVPSALVVPTAISPAQVAKVTTTLHSFPTLEPLAFLEYPATHLYLPLRRDILHRAVVFEADASRQGTANTKWRDEVRGSGRKIRPQKGTGRARLGDKKSPMLRGGGRAFGPKPRSFATGLQKKVYDLAWRTALSYRYRKGELVVVDELAVGNWGEFWGEELRDVRERDYRVPFYVKYMMERLGWGQKDRRSMLITTKARKEQELELYRSLELRGEQGRVRAVGEVDVKNLLEMGRVVIEKEALDQILIAHQSDLGIEAQAKTALWSQEQMEREALALQTAMLDQNTSTEELEDLLTDDIYEDEEADFEVEESEAPRAESTVR